MEVTPTNLERQPTPSKTPLPHIGLPDGSSSSRTLLERIEGWEDRFGVEARGIQRVPPSDRNPVSLFGTVQIALSWFSINLVANNTLVGMLGPWVFRLSFRDSALLCLFGNILGAVGPAYISGLGPKSGNRTMVILRFVFGWWPAKLCACLQLIGTLGYGLLAALITGQILSAVSTDGKMSVVVGVIIAGIVVMVVCVVGMRVFHVYERYAMIPSLIVYFIMIGSAGPNFNTTAPSLGTPDVIRGNQISFFFVVFNTAFIWSMCSADYFVYYSETMPRAVVGTMSHIGVCLGLLFSELIGVGLASGAASKIEWGDALSVSPGAMMAEAYTPLGGFGKFCAVVLALGPIANTIPGIYSSALAWQILGRGWEKVPRAVWTVFGILVYTICAIVGRNSIFTIFENFLALMGPWVAGWVTIQLSDELVFRRHRKWRWEDWDKPEKLPVGIAALAAFLVGWAGAILGMSQVWWVGPIARRAKGDLGVPIMMAWAALVYPPLRWLEMRHCKK